MIYMYLMTSTKCSLFYFHFTFTHSDGWIRDIFLIHKANELQTWGEKNEKKKKSHTMFYAQSAQSYICVYIQRTIRWIHRNEINRKKKLILWYTKRELSDYESLKCTYSKRLCSMRWPLLLSKYVGTYDAPYVLLLCAHTYVLCQCDDLIYVKKIFS